MNRPPPAPGRPPLLADFAPADQVEVRALILAGLAEHWPVVDPSANPDLDDIALSYRHGRVVVVRQEAAGPIVATGTLVPDTRRDRRTGQIVRMSVAAEHRGTGLGRVVVDELARTARSWGLTRLVLETTSTWTEVIGFYQACGFTPTHEAETAFGAITWFSLDL